MATAHAQTTRDWEAGAPSLARRPSLLAGGKTPAQFSSCPSPPATWGHLGCLQHRARRQVRCSNNRVHVTRVPTRRSRCARPVGHAQSWHLQDRRETHCSWGQEIHHVNAPTVSLRPFGTPKGKDSWPLEPEASPEPRDSMGLSPLDTPAHGATTTEDIMTGPRVTGGRKTLHTEGTVLFRMSGRDHTASGRCSRVTEASEVTADTTLSQIPGQKEEERTSWGQWSSERGPRTRQQCPSMLHVLTDVAGTERKSLS